MAGDWIKMRADLFTHPKVVRISSAFRTDVLRTVGGLMSVWCLFDAHSVDGKLEGYDRATLDDHIRWPGFSDALIGIGWLEQDGEALVLPRFSSHNGQSAKRRATDAERKREARNHPNSVRNVSAQESDKTRTREEKRREDRKPPKSPKGEPVGFAEFYEAYPKKQAKAAAARAFAKVTVPVAVLLAALAWQRNQDSWKREDGKYIPLPATWLNDKRWEDEKGAEGEAAEWHQSRSGVEGKAKQLGVSPWNENEEHWPTFKQRVMKAERTANPGMTLEQLMRLAPKQGVAA